MSKLTRTVTAVVALSGALVVVGPATSAMAVVPPPPAIAEGPSGSVDLTPTLEPGESVAVSTTGFSPAERLGDITNPYIDFHSGVSVDRVDDGNVLLGDDVWVADATMVRFETIVADPAVDLEMEITWIEQGDLNVGGQWIVNTPGAIDRIDLPGYFGEWLVVVRQLSGPGGVFFDTTGTVVRQGGAPLTLSTAVASDDAPTVTANWSGLATGTTHLATVDWGSPQQRSIVEVSTGPVDLPSIPTVTTARLSSSIEVARSPTFLITRVSAVTNYSLQGELRLRVDGVIRSTMEIFAYTDRVFTLRVPDLAPGLHEVKAEFRPVSGVVDPSNSPVRRLLVTR